MSTPVDDPAPVRSVAPTPALPAWRWLTRVASSRTTADRSVRVTAGLTVLAAGWFALGPDAFQLLGIRAIVPPLAGMTAAGQWRLAGDRRLSAAASRFWLLLSIALVIFTAGMVVDFAVELSTVLGGPRGSAGEIVLFPIAGLFAIVALVVYPTALRSPLDRLKIGLDIAIVLFGCAAFVWFFMGNQLWRPGDDLGLLADRLVLPALTLLAGFAVLRITLAGANVICRRTMFCFVFAASTATASILMRFSPGSVGGRIGSMLQVLALGACVLGVAMQRAAPPASVLAPSAAPSPAGRLRYGDVGRPGWRLGFSVLPYVALAATLGLLLTLIAEHLNYQGWVVAIGVLVLCAAVVLRQLTASWENSRLLASNRELTERLRHQAYHDHLTGLANRALFTERVAAAIDGTRPVGWRGGGEIAVLFVDLDDFKVVNDSLGHHVGDELLVAVARRLDTVVGAADTLCRLGGDEFALLLAETDADGAANVARQVAAALERPMRPAGIEVRVTASVGIARAAAGEPGVVELLRNADVAMYSAKHTRNGGCRVFEPSMLTGPHRNGQ